MCELFPSSLSFLAKESLWFLPLSPTEKHLQLTRFYFNAVGGNSHLTPSTRLVNPLVNARLQLTLLLFPARWELLISSSDLLSDGLIYKFIFSPFPPPPAIEVGREYKKSS